MIDDAVRLPVSLEPEVLKNGDVRARIIHVDRFGNCVTNITRDLVKPNATLVVNRKTIREFRRFYGEDSAKTPFAIWGSAGFLEIAINGGSAAKILKATRDDEVVLPQRRKGAKKK
jgi:S-adenosylmethionine hydrolase